MTVSTPHSSNSTPFHCGFTILKYLSTETRKYGYVAVVCAGGLLGGCREAEDRSPGLLLAQQATLSTVENQPVESQLSGADSKGRALQFQIVSPPAHGEVTLDATSGHVRYVPKAYYAGPDQFTFLVSNGKNNSAPALVDIAIQDVNFPPTLSRIPSLQNSAETRQVVYALGANDVDNDVLAIRVTALDPSVADVAVDQELKLLTITPRARGKTAMKIAVSDAEFTIEQNFDFEVGDVVKTIALASSGPEGKAIVLTNTSEKMVDFSFQHNGFPVFEAYSDVVAFVRAMPEHFPDEPFESKLWRFIRDNVYHWPEPEYAQWQNDPWVILNSSGFSTCGAAAVSYALLAKTAGYTIRIQHLEGHVVPEIMIDGQWRMYDPDLAVYYRRADGAVAGVEDLIAHPDLMTAPVNPIFEDLSYGAEGNSLIVAHPYSPFVAQIYTTTQDNYVADSVYVPQTVSPSGRFWLPPGATFTYPGKWTDTPALADGSFPVPHFKQARLDLPAGWHGNLLLPLMLWDLQGEGEVRLNGTVYAVGSAELTELVRRTAFRAIDSLEIVRSSQLSLVFSINAVRFFVQQQNTVQVKGVDVYAIDAGIVDMLDEHAVPGGLPIGHQKPTASGY